MTVTPEASDQVVAPSRDAAARGGRTRRLLTPALVVYVTVVAFPGWFMPVQPGLDPSWVYALNALPHTSFGFGPDVAFTYGPLGRLLFPMPIEGNLAQAAASWVVFALALSAVLTYHALRQRRPTRLVAFAAVFVLALSFGLPYEYWWSLLVALLLFVPATDRWWPVAASLASAGAAVLLFAKTTMGMAGLSMLVLYAVARLATRSAPRRMALYLFAPYLVTYFALGAVLIGSPGAVMAWTARSLEIARGFGAAMSFPGATAGVVAGLTAVGLYVGLLAWAWFRDREGFVVAASLLGVVYVGFRHGLIRHQGRYVAPAVLGALAVVALRALPRRSVAAVAAAVVGVVVVATALTFRDECGCPFRWEIATGVQGWGNISRTLDLGDVTDDLRSQEEALLEPDVLPAGWVSRIRRGGGVDVLPWEIAYTAANGLAWRPNPVIQTYHAYTAGLDRSVEDHFSSDRAPPHLLVQFADIDGRYPLWASPGTWRAVLSNYELVAAGGPARFDRVALLARRSTPVPLAGRPLGSTTASVGEWVPIPRSPTLVFAGIDLRLGLNGMLASFLWRVEPVLVDFRFADGRLLTLRMLPATAGNGVLASHLPFNFGQFVDFLEGRLPPRAVAFRIHGPGTGSYERGFTVRWRGADWVARTPRAAGAASAA